jgi:hypothetical protein
LNGLATHTPDGVAPTDASAPTRAAEADICAGRSVAHADPLVTTQAALTSGTRRSADATDATSIATGAGIAPRGIANAANPGTPATGRAAGVENAPGVAHAQTAPAGPPGSGRTAGARAPHTLVTRSEGRAAARNAGTQTQSKEQPTDRRRLHCPDS